MSNNGLSVQPIQPVYELNKIISKRSKYIEYHCELCNCIHWKTLGESYLIKGKWYCKESVDNFNRRDK